MDMTTPELDPASRMALVAQKLKEANALRATIPRSNGEIVGGQYIPPIADWSRSIFDRLDANATENEALAELRKLSSDKSTAMSNFSKKYGNIDFNTDDGKKRLFQGLLEYMNTPALSDSDVGKLLTTLLKPSSSLNDIIAVNSQLAHKGTGEVIAEIPPSTFEKEQAKLRDADRNTDNERQRLAAEESIRQHNERMKQLELDSQARNDARITAQQDRRAKEDQRVFEHFDAATKELRDPLILAQQVQHLLEQYPDKLPGLDNPLKRKSFDVTGGIGLSSEEKDVLSLLERFHGFFKKKQTGAAAADAEAVRIANEIGQTSLTSTEDYRKIMPRVFEYFNMLNRAHRSLLAHGPNAEQEAQRILDDRPGHPLRFMFEVPKDVATPTPPNGMGLPEPVAAPGTDPKHPDIQGARDYGQQLNKIRERKLPNGKTVIIEEH